MLVWRAGGLSSFTHMLGPNERSGFGLELAEAAYKPEKAVQAKLC